MGKLSVVVVAVLLATAAVPSTSLAGGRAWKAAGKASTVITGIQTIGFLYKAAQYSPKKGCTYSVGDRQKVNWDCVARALQDDFRRR
jgi:hypothetical protein